MKTYKKHLKEKLKDREFKKLMKKKNIVRFAMKIAAAREKLGVSQHILQKKLASHRTVSKIENGMNCNMNTFLKVASIRHTI